VLSLSSRSARPSSTSFEVSSSSGPPHITGSAESPALGPHFRASPRCLRCPAQAAVGWAGGRCETHRGKIAHQFLDPSVNHSQVASQVSNRPPRTSWDAGVHIWTIQHGREQGELFVQRVAEFEVVQDGRISQDRPGVTYRRGSEVLFASRQLWRGSQTA
jgi:hypothetical protein